MDADEAVRELKCLLGLTSPRTENKSLLNERLDKRQEAVYKGIDALEAQGKATIELPKELNPYACGMGNVVDYNKGIRACKPAFAKLIREVDIWKENYDCLKEHRDRLVKEKEELQREMGKRTDWRNEEIKRLQQEKEELQKVLETPERWMKWCDIKVLEENERLKKEKEELADKIQELYHHEAENFSLKQENERLTKELKEAKENKGGKGR